MAGHLVSAPDAGTPQRHVRRRKPRRPKARLPDLERRYDGAIPAEARPDSTASIDRIAALRFWRHEVREAIAALRLWRSGGDLRRNAVAPSIAQLREATLTRRVATAWSRYRQAQQRGC